MKPEAGRYDASYGLVLLNQGSMEFAPLSAARSGLRLDGEIRNLQWIQSVEEGKQRLWVIKNNDAPEVYEK